MTFKDADGMWSDLPSSCTSLCSAFMILIAVLWFALVVSMGPPLIMGPSDPFTVYVVPILGPSILLLMGIVILIISMKFRREKAF
ncbi:MAG: hypothetical protein RTU92_04115 [Candidatus Thorarchaeota archaeon]